MQRSASSLRSRYPLGVIVVIVIAALRSVTIVFELAKVDAGGVFGWIVASGPLPEFRPGSDAELIGQVLLVGLLATSLLVVVGLGFHRRWGWVLAIVTSGLILAIDLGWWWSGEARYGSMLLNVIAVFYLNQRDVRASLRGRSGRP
jgi:hypothetical protein